MITVLVVVTNGGMKLWGHEIANIQAIGVECTSVIVAVQLLFNVTNRNQAIAVERPAVGDGFC